MSDRALAEALERYRARVHDALLERLPPLDSASPRLAEAMRYAVTVGGKRVRPVLTYATGSALGAPLERLDTPACAVEMVHAYSLVHDDLPAMDDDDLRRGQPTCHRRFDEATAILAGDALQALAFTILAGDAGPARPGHDDPEADDSEAGASGTDRSTGGNPAGEASEPLPSAKARLDMVRILGEASGASGMAAGQAIDLEAVGRTLTLESLENMHRHKTGALIRASVRLALAAAERDDAGLARRLDDYAAAVGLSFQIVDDILDVVSDTETLGKAQGADIARDKPTYPALLGLEGARRHADDMHRRALDALDGLGSSFEELRELSSFVVERTY